MEGTIDISIRRAAEILKAEGAREVYLFGSEVDGTPGKGLDVDLAVTGLPPTCYYHVVGLLLAVIRRPLDLVDLDESTPFTEYLKVKGNLQRVA